MSILTSKKRHFTLKNVNIAEIHQTYGFVIVSNLEKDVIPSSTKTTKITDIMPHEVEYVVCFLDENKKENKCIVTMVEWLRREALPRTTPLHCFWCRHAFETSPIGCPIKFVNSAIEKSYISQITKDKYYMKENVTKRKLEDIMKNKEELRSQHIEISPFENDYFLTDGVFCSFNCTLAFIKDHNQDIFYKESYSLLYSLYEQLVGKRATKITPAPHWRLLKEYGGHLSIERFRDAFNTLEYEFMFNIREMRTISKVFKEMNI